MEVIVGLLILAAAVGLTTGCVLGVVRYLHAVGRASERGADWVPFVMRVGFPLYAGVAACHVVMGSARMVREMGGWYWGSNVAAITLATVACAHWVIRARVRRGDGGDRVIALGLLTLIVGASWLSGLLALLGDHAAR